MNLQNVLAALESCEIDNKISAFNEWDLETYECFKFENGSYVKEYTNPDRPAWDNLRKKEFTDEYDFLIHWLRNRYVRFENSQSKQYAIIFHILFCLVKKTDISEDSLMSIHQQLFKLSNKELNDTVYHFHIIFQKGELFNQVNDYGIGYVDGKYIVAEQKPYCAGDRPNPFFYENECNTFAEAMERLNIIAKADIHHREMLKEEEILNYQMTKQDEKLLQVSQDIIKTFCGSYKPNLKLFPSGQQFIKTKHTSNGYSAIEVDTERGLHEWVILTEKSLNSYLDKLFLWVQRGSEQQYRIEDIMNNDAVNHLMNTVTEETYGTTVYRMLQHNGWK